MGGGRRRARRLLGDGPHAPLGAGALMGLKAVPPKRKLADRLFLRWFREHVGRSEKCACSLAGPARDCDVGYALIRAAHPVDWGNPEWATF